jgi:hypothetical protein
MFNKQDSGFSRVVRYVLGFVFGVRGNVEKKELELGVLVEVDEVEFPQNILPLIHFHIITSNPHLSTAHIYQTPPPPPYHFPFTTQPLTTPSIPFHIHSHRQQTKAHLRLPL